MALTDIKIKSLTAKPKAYQVADSEGLYIDILPSGLKVWRMRYRLNGASGKHEKVTIGKYPDIGLAEARLKRSEYKRMVKNGESPALAKQHHKIAARDSDTVSDFALVWYQQTVLPNNKTPRNIERVLNKDILPLIGNKKIQDVTQTDILKITDKIKNRGADTAALLARNILKRFFEYAISREKVTFNPAAAIQAQHIATASSRDRALSANDLALLMKAIYKSSMRQSNKLALHLLILTMVRKSELLEAKWSEIDLEQGIWIIPTERMKKNRSHVVYLSKQAIELFSELKQLASHSDYVLPSPSSNVKPISKTTLNQAIKGLGIDIEHFVLHDFRRTASTHLHETGFNSDVIEKALAHEQGGVRGIYNKAEYKEQRKEMLQTWAGFIESLITDNKVVLGNFRKTA